MTGRRIFNLCKDDLHKLYWVDGLSSYQIGEKFHVSPGAVLYLMKKYGIPRHPPGGRKGVGKGHVAWNRGKKCPNVSRGLKRFYQSGGRPWNKDLTKETDERVKRNVEASGKASRGRRSPFKGLTKETDERARKISESLMGRTYTPTWKPTQKQLEALARGRRLGPLVLKGKPRSAETKRLISEKNRKNRLHQIFPKKDTSIEIALQETLEANAVNFETHKPILGQPDIFIEPNICIFADGDYWHNYPDGRDRDREITKKLEKEGYIVLRFWEHQINNSVGWCVNQILDAK